MLMTKRPPIARETAATSSAVSEASRTNPFATRYTRPGAIEFVFVDGQSAASLVEKLRQQSWWGAILGPHGAGKSTLLETLEPALAEAGRQIVHFSLHDNERSLPVHASDAASWSDATQVVVDGYEQLSWWGRLRLKSLCRRRGAGLLVTAHAPVDLPELYQVQPSLEATRQVVAELLRVVTQRTAAEAAESNQPLRADVITPDDVAVHFDIHHGNVRETLFALFDLYRQRTANSQPGP
jgi:hypothetical protein